MAPYVTALLVLACTLLSLAAGYGVRGLLPSHHLSDESKSAGKVGAALIATLVALVLGLLVGSAKSGFDAVNNGLRETGSEVLTLNDLMVGYGPESAEARKFLRQALSFAIARTWPDQARTGEPAGSATSLNDVHRALLQLTPHTPYQEDLRSEALSLSLALAKGRWQLLEQVHGSLPIGMLALLVFWLCILFFQFGLYSPRNSTVLLFFFLCAASTAGAIFLILEMSLPFHGLIRVSSAPMMMALEQLSK